MNIEKMKRKLNTPFRWLIEGAIWGLWMFIVAGVLLDWFLKEPITFNKLVTQFAKWMVAGLIYGWITVKFLWPYLLKTEERKLEQ